MSELVFMKASAPRDAREAAIMQLSSTVIGVGAALQLTPSQFAVVLGCVIPRLCAQEPDVEQRTLLIIAIKEQIASLDQMVDRYLAHAAGGSGVTQ